MVVQGIRSEIESNKKNKYDIGQCKKYVLQVTNNSVAYLLRTLIYYKFCDIRVVCIILNLKYWVEPNKIKLEDK